MKNKIEEMLINQNKLNIRTAGDLWTFGSTDKGLTIDWLRCIRAESNELRNSYPWEHWVDIDAEADIINAYVEVADLWHFLMSYCISVNSQLSYSELAEELTLLFLDKRLSVERDIVSLTEDLDKVTYNEHDYKYLVYKFIKILDGMDINFDKLYGFYNGKRVLNSFRQDHGYKEGKYSKLWNNVEDNKYMLKILETNPAITDKALYASLEFNYGKYV